MTYKNRVEKLIRITAVLLLNPLNLFAGEKPLPDVLETVAGQEVTSVEQWEQIRRPEVLEIFKTEVYGKAPVGRPDDLRFEVKEVNKNALDGAATLKRIQIHFSGHGGKGMIALSLFIPNNATKPSPGFLLICNRDKEHIDPTRKNKSPFWPVEAIVARGYVAAAFHNSDLDPDNYDSFKNGVHGIFDIKTPDSDKRPADAWGTLSAWAWGASRVMDYFETDPDIDEKHIGVVGHSRGGKTALWCGAVDQRFALAISNNSGSGGASLGRNKKSRDQKGMKRGERIHDLNRTFPHWFCGNYKKYNNKENELPVDQHALIALMAPRLVYVASASKDYWADPQGEFLSCVHAGPVYELLGLKGVGASVMPEVHEPLHSGHIGYHIRDGKHNLVEYDWNCFMDFADKHWKNN